MKESARLSVQAPSGRAAGAALAVAGMAGTTLAAMTDAQRSLVALAAAAWFLLLFPLSGALLAALAGLIRSRWIRARHPQVLGLVQAWFRPAAGFAIVVVLLAVAGWNGATGSAGPSPSHRSWLQLVFPAAGCALWLGLAVRLQADSSPPSGFRAPVTYLLLFLPTFWLATDEWLAGFSPGCRSPLGGFYQWAGLLLLGTALLAWRETTGRGGEVSGVQFRDLSRFLLFASCLWLYTWFCRHLTVWYTGLPAEAECMLLRASGSWAAVYWAVPALNWAVPCALLLPGRAKSDREVVRLAAGLVLAGRWLDVYCSMVPEQGPLGLAALLADHSPLAAMAGLWWARIPGRREG